MCLFCDTRLNTIRDIQLEIAELQQAVRENKEAMRTECTRNNKPIEQAHRRQYQRAYYLANQEKKRKAAKDRYYGLTAEATI